MATVTICDECKQPMDDVNGFRLTELWMIEINIDGVCKSPGLDICSPTCLIKYAEVAERMRK